MASAPMAAAPSFLSIFSPFFLHIALHIHIMIVCIDDFRRRWCRSISRQLERGARP
jgi:hypothetical protein